jgi:hypothetical protein
MAINLTPTAVFVPTASVTTRLAESSRGPAWIVEWSWTTDLPEGMIQRHAAVSVHWPNTGAAALAAELEAAGWEVTVNDGDVNTYGEGSWVLIAHPPSEGSDEANGPCSKGHRAFCGNFELFVGPKGDLWRAKRTAHLNGSGYRTGARWEAPSHMADDFIAMYTEGA